MAQEEVAFHEAARKVESKPEAESNPAPASGQDTPMRSPARRTSTQIRNMGHDFSARKLQQSSAFGQSDSLSTPARPAFAATGAPDWRSDRAPTRTPATEALGASHSEITHAFSSALCRQRTLRKHVRHGL